MKKQMTLGKRITLGFASLILITAVLSVFAYIKLTAIHTEADSLASESIPSTVIAGKLSEFVARHCVEVTAVVTNPDAKQKQAARDAMAGITKDFEASVAAYEKAMVHEEGKQLLKDVLAARAPYREAVGATLALVNESRNEEAAAMLMERVLPTYREYLANAREIAEWNEKTALAESAGITANAVGAVMGIQIAMGLSLVIGVGVSFLVVRSINKALNRMAGTLGDGSAQVAAASGQLSASSQSIAQGASEQAAALEETTSALEEMSSMTRKNAETAQQAAALAGEAQKAATEGNAAMTKMSSAITDIQKSATETGKIIKVIDEIAFQTNLLALNAAVEAARAGEAGKGFAVVAEEVRNLAMRSAEAAKNTAAMIEESVTNSRNGVSIVGEVGKTLGEITAAATKVNGLIAEIAAASQEQSQGIGQVNTAVSQMDKVTQSNAANAEESASASEELSSQAEALRNVVQELVALVGGRSEAENQPTRQVKKNQGAKAKMSFSKSNKAAQMIPLDDDDRAMNAGSHSQGTGASSRSFGGDFADFGKAA